MQLGRCFKEPLSGEECAFSNLCMEEFLVQILK
jgi:hypothetical protein